MAYGTINRDASVTSWGDTSAGLYGFKNRILNGNMSIDQRNAGASVTATNFAYTLDRWKTATSSASKYTVQQNAGSVTPPVGFTNYLGITSSAATSVGSTDYYFLMQLIEGFNVADLAWGTINAKPVTLSFWVRSSLTGTFGGSLENNAGNRSYPFSYTISSANTWTQISVTITGETTGTWITNNGNGMYVQFSLGVGSTRQTTAGAWASGDYQSVTGETQIVATNGATFYITGVQLEKGTTATSFDYRPYGTELALCQRYCYKFGGGSTNDAFGSGFGAGGSSYVFVPFPIAMRATPSLTLYGTASDVNVTTPGVAAAANGTPSVIGTGINSTALQIGSATSITSGYGVYARIVSSSTWITMTAEL